MEFAFLDEVAIGMETFEFEHLNRMSRIGAVVLKQLRQPRNKLM